MLGHPTIERLSEALFGTGAVAIIAAVIGSVLYHKYNEKK
jgi:hypothetical protein